MTCQYFGEIFRLAPLTCTDIGDFIKVACAVVGTIVAWKKANQFIGLRKREVTVLEGTTPPRS
jgi:hypothetical protein